MRFIGLRQKSGSVEIAGKKDGSAQVWWSQGSPREGLEKLPLTARDCSESLILFKNAGVTAYGQESSYNEQLSHRPVNHAGSNSSWEIEAAIRLRERHCSNSFNLFKNARVTAFEKGSGIVSFFFHFVIFGWISCSVHFPCYLQHFGAGSGHFDRICNMFEIEPFFFHGIGNILVLEGSVSNIVRVGLGVVQRWFWGLSKLFVSIEACFTICLALV